MRRKIRLLALAILLVLGTAGVVGILSLHGRPHPAGAVSGGCGVGVPANKCNPIVSPTTAPAPPGSTIPQTAIPPPPSTGVASLPATPPITQCGAGFFTSAELQRLSAHFGMENCFKFDGSNQWIIFGNGESVTSPGTPPPAAPGGSMVAVLECSTSDAGCLSATSAHLFSSFTVYYPPNPGRSVLLGSYGEGILQIANGGCSVFLFDVNTLTWYRGTASEAQSLAKGDPLSGAVTVPPPATGAAAQAQAAPFSSRDCPQY